MLALSPQGMLRQAAHDPEVEPDVADDARGRIDPAFASGPGVGLLQLAAVEVTTPLPPSYAYFRELGRLYVTRLRTVPDLEALREKAVVVAPAEELQRLAGTAPAIPGAEYVSVDVLAALWGAIEEAVHAELAAWRGTVAEYLAGKNPVWSLVGRVCFHLAENKADPEHPFAFLATYSTRVGGARDVKHLPLSRALKELASDKQALLSLLLPVQRAAKESALAKALLDSGDLFHPLAWTPKQAHELLQQIPALETAGVVVRVPDWWRARRRPRVTVSVGDKAPSLLGVDAMLDFQLGVALGGEKLSEKELRELLAGTDGLQLVRGQWVELDRARLEEVLGHWKTALQAHKKDGLSFAEGMRLLAGVELGADGAAGAEDARSWSEVVAGPWLAEALAGVRREAAAEDVERIPGLVASLRHYQAAGVRWLRMLSGLGLGACLADDMGLGKTVQVIALLLLRRAGRVSAARKAKGGAAPSLLVVPASLIANWESELARFAPELRALVAHPSVIPAPELAKLPPARLEGVDLVITTYGTTHRLGWLAETTWDLAILDEAQAIKNPGAKQTRAVKGLRASARIALTGTPVENRLADLWSLFDFLNPGLLGSARAFGQLAKRLQKSGDPAAFAPLRRLIGPYILRRLKSDRRVVADLPDKTEVKAFCTLSKAQAALYEDTVRELGRQLREVEGIKRRGLVLASLLRLKQICNHPAQWLKDGDWAEARSGKLARVREICEAIAARQEKALVFTQFREVTEPLARFLGEVFGRPGLVLHGETPVRARKGLVQRFQEDESVPFFVLSVKAGGTGLNLTAASHVLHFDRWWNPAVEDQATDRAYRLGQHKNVLVHKLVCRGTVEEKIDALLESKQGLSRELLSEAGETLLTEMKDKDLMALVSLDLHRALEEAGS